MLANIRCSAELGCVGREVEVVERKPSFWAYLDLAPEPPTEIFRRKFGFGTWDSKLNQTEKTLPFILGDASMIVPQDIDENGMFDLFVQKPLIPGVREKSDLQIVLNNQILDAFFFKSTMIYFHDD